MKIPNQDDKQSFKEMIQRFLIKRMNPVLFRKYISHLKTPVGQDISENQTNNEEQNIGEEQKIQEVGEQITETEIIDAELKNDEELSLENIVNEQETSKTHKTYNIKLKDYFLIIIYIISSNTQHIVYLFFFLNHYYNASLESLVFPLSVCAYALLEYPRPPSQYFKFMLFYTLIIFFIKFSLQLYV